jgi:hypothetical protein
MHRLIEATPCQALTWGERDANEIRSKFLLGILQSIAAKVKQREKRASHFRESYSNWQTMSGEGGGACVFLGGN